MGHSLSREDSVLRSALAGDRNCSAQRWHGALPVLNQEMSTEEKVGEGLPGKYEHQLLLSWSGRC